MENSTFDARNITILTKEHIYCIMDTDYDRESWDAWTEITPIQLPLPGPFQYGGRDVRYFRRYVYNYYNGCPGDEVITIAEAVDQHKLIRQSWALHALSHYSRKNTYVV
jgi:hypothetical protein